MKVEKVKCAQDGLVQTTTRIWIEALYRKLFNQINQLYHL